jgi:hypothetical protein
MMNVRSVQRRFLPRHRGGRRGRRSRRRVDSKTVDPEIDESDYCWDVTDQALRT